MDPRGPAVIDFIEATYDLESDEDRWLDGLVERGGPLLDAGLGAFAFDVVRPPRPGPVLIENLRLREGVARLGEGLSRLQGQADVMTALWPITRSAAPKTLSEVTRDHAPEIFDSLTRGFRPIEDALGLSALEQDGHGVYLILPLSRKAQLTTAERERWHMIAAHLRAGYRLRRALASRRDTSPSELPYGAEAIIEPRSFRVTDVVGEAKQAASLDALRKAAVDVDRARGKLRKQEPQRALELWRALVRGRWSTIDWFDSDGRRYIVGVPNAPGIADPRRLTERERQVVACAAAGSSNKLIGYQLGLSKGRVSALLSSAMRKLGVKNRIQLIQSYGSFADDAGAT